MNSVKLNIGNIIILLLVVIITIVICEYYNVQMLTIPLTFIITGLIFNFKK